MNILISGANGFIGSSLYCFLINEGHTISTIPRHPSPQNSGHLQYDCLIHLAGRAHILRETSEDAYHAFNEANVGYTLKVAELAKKLAIKRFVFISSIGVNGKHSGSLPFTEQDIPKPHNDYARSKWEAELALKGFFEGTETELTIIRPPLVYGPNPKANFKTLVSLCKYPIPLPFGAIHNKRSLVGIDNLCHFISLCCQHSEAADQTFLISDDQDVSLTELITTIRKALNQPAWLLPVPNTWLRSFFNFLGKDNLSDQLLANLQVDVSKAKQLLGWKPILRLDEGIKNAVISHVD
ncbi:NAD-dependent epimerase/dehydratase family protein [Methylophilus sp. 14]|uniref:NAD-dependent epimerase/dehydratase family protein n=1 Tax=Methylophilus sp. 14 TaxID=2781019 RepID=UPI00188E034A|nr:NAD-dependent epimerase/dehydratase family protein [Methylophilus sp. 14]MBF4988687.1 NAD-dependent epimerase/dehydratase family protein [Methylophilus sp. 14]